MKNFEKIIELFVNKSFFTKQYVLYVLEFYFAAKPTSMITLHIT